MISFIKANMYSIITILAAIVILLYLYKKGKKKAVRNIVLSLVVQAEKALGSGTGQLKYAMVVDSIYRVLPPILTFLISKKELDQIIENAVDEMKEYLKETDLVSYEEEYKYINKFNI